MLDFVGGRARRFEVLGRGEFTAAREELASKFPTDAPSLVLAQEKIALPLKAALESGGEPIGRLTLKLSAKGEHEALGDFGGPHKASGELHFVELGGQVFPIGLRSLEYGRKAMTLYEPRPADEFDPKAIAKDGLDAFYADADPKDVARVRLGRDAGPRTLVETEKHATRDLSWGWALWETASSMVRRAVTEPARSDEARDLYARARAKARPTKSGAPTLLEALPHLIAGRGRAEGSGPPRGTDLIEAFSWNGVPVAVTFDRGGDAPVSVAVQDKLDGKLAWFPIAFPAGANGVPVRGVSAALAGDKLKLFGGIDADGNVLTHQWTIDLKKAREAAYSDRVRLEPSWALEDARAFAVAVANERETLVAGGLAGYYAKENGGTPKLLRTMATEPSGGGRQWGRRAAAPTELAECSTVVQKGVVFFGPGAARDGRVYAYDASAEGGWVRFPDLPQALGLGQVQILGDRLVYSGGFFADGKPSRAIYALDLESTDPSWTKLGESDFVAGKARLVEAHGRLISLLVSPKGRITFHPGLEGGG